MKKVLRCYNCGGNMEETQTSIEYSVGGYTITIKGVTGFVCESCGTKMFSPNEMIMAERLTEAFRCIETQDKPEYLNVTETADLLRVSNQTIYNMIREGRLNPTKVGREWRFLRKSIESVLGVPEALAARNVADKVSETDRKEIESVLEEMKSE